MQRQKRLMMLGGSRFQVPAIKHAKSRGHYVITCDYLPDNPGHAFSDEYHNVSTTDEAQVLDLAQRLGIDGIVAYASDPAAPTAALVGNELGLPSNPYDSVNVLTQKDLFRTFLANNGFNSPKHISFTNVNDANNHVITKTFPLVVKPVDSSGSKGVTVIRSADELATAYELANSFSRAKRVIIEEFVPKQEYQIAGDGFVQEGVLTFRCFANEHFRTTGNNLVPIGESFPSLFPEYVLSNVHKEIQRLLTLLEIRTGALNFDIRIDDAGKIWLMEIGPRNGGNLIPEVIQLATGVNLIQYTVDAALGLPLDRLSIPDNVRCYSCYMIHSEEDGVFDCLDVDRTLRSCIEETSLWVRPGDSVNRFEGSHNTLGTMILKFSNPQTMVQKMDNMPNLIRVRTSKCGAS
jgi:biotin carboxylase